MITLYLTKDRNIEYYGTTTPTVPMEEYLIGCVAQEIGNAPLEACKAQAIAARTNCLYNLNHGLKITDNSSVFQAFNAERIENSQYVNVQQAVRETKDLVLYYQDKLIHPASFSLNNGGRTTSSESRWGGYRPYLIEKDDPWDKILSHGHKRGHGVGLSQMGAKQMAFEGFNYQVILSFYYPNTTIGGSIMNKNEKVRDWAMSKIGCGYVWGATGQILNESSLRDLKERYPDHVNEEIVRRWMGKPVFDCASFVRNGMREAGIRMVSGASSQWKKTDWAETGTIETLPMDRVCCLYRADPRANPMQHTGLYLGNGKVADARGSREGVLLTNLSQYHWSHWGLPKGLDEDLGEDVSFLYKVKLVAETGDTVNLRADPSRHSERLARIPLGEVVGVIEEAGNYVQVQYGSQKGFIEKRFTQREGVAEETWYVKVECKNEADAKAIASAFRNAKVIKS